MAEGKFPSKLQCHKKFNKEYKNAYLKNKHTQLQKY